MKSKALKVATLAFAVALISGNSAQAVSQDWVLPNSQFTPGAINPAVTQGNIQSTICVSGFTDSIRPPVSYTNKLKKIELAAGGSYFFEVAGFGSALGNYELDHLISLQLGGNPTDVKNLWVEPYSGNNARKKDVIETALKRLVCSNKMLLVDAQKAISTNWVAAYNKYVTPADVKSASANG
jgi:hypothetical protein